MFVSDGEDIWKPADSCVSHEDDSAELHFEGFDQAARERCSGGDQRERRCKGVDHGIRFVSSFAV